MTDPSSDVSLRSLAHTRPHHTTIRYRVAQRMWFSLNADYVSLRLSVICLDGGDQPGVGPVGGGRFG